MSEYSQYPWRWNHVQHEGRTIALHLETTWPEVPCKDPVLFSVREDWIGAFRRHDYVKEAAQLIVTAPKLLDALKDARAELDVSRAEQEQGSTSYLALSEAIDKADAAIAEAESEFKS